MKILFWILIICGIVLNGAFFLPAIFILPAVCPDDFNEFIEDWKGLFK